MSLSRKSWSIGAVAFVALAAAACSGTSSAGGPGGGGGAGTPITVAFAGTMESSVYNFPESAAAVQARAAAQNAAGGVDGHPIKVITCNDQADPNEAAVCARDAQSAGAVAVVGGVSAQGNALASALQGYGIVYTGMRPLSPGELSSPISFPLVGGSSSSGGGAGMYAADQLKCKVPYTVTGDVPANQSSRAAFVAGVEAAHGPAVKGIVTPAAVADYAPVAAAAASAHADCIFLAMAPEEIAKAVPALRAADQDATVMGTAGGFPPPTLKALGALADGIVLTDSQVPLSTPGNPVIKQFENEMTTYQPDATQDGFALSSWYATKILFDEVLDKLTGTIDAPSVLAAYQHLGTVPGGGIEGDFSFQSPSPVKDQPRQFNRTYVVITVEDGQQTLASGAKFFDATDALTVLG